MVHARRLHLLATPLFLIFAYIIVKAWPVFSLDYLWLNPSNKGQSGGIWAPLIGTFSLVIGSLLVVAPNRSSRGDLSERIRAGQLADAGHRHDGHHASPAFPDRHALFGLGAFVLGLLPVVNRVFADPNDRDTHWEAGLLTASLTIAVMVLPIIITSTREALGAVPMAFREACWNLGASRWQTIRTVVLPNSLSGILTGIILTVERAAGETAPILFTGATSSNSSPTMAGRNSSRITRASRSWPCPCTCTCSRRRCPECPKA